MTSSTFAEYEEDRREDESETDAETSTSEDEEPKTLDEIIETYAN